MGWSSGTELFEKVIKTLKKNVPDDAVRVKLYADLIEAFEDGDWDNQNEVEGLDPAYDKVWKKLRKKRGWDE